MNHLEPHGTNEPLRAVYMNNESCDSTSLTDIVISDIIFDTRDRRRLIFSKKPWKSTVIFHVPNIQTFFVDQC